MSAPPGSSKRWQHFHSALQLATQRVCNKWTFEDFEECFPHWCREEREGARQTMSVLARGMQSTIEQSTQILLEKNNAAQGIDTLHECVLRAREAKKAGIVPPDAWKSDLDPRIAVRARTIPRLERELEKLKQEYEELVKENKTLAERLVQSKDETINLETRTKESLELLDQSFVSLDAVNWGEIVDATLSSKEANEHPHVR